MFNERPKASGVDLANLALNAAQLKKLYDIQSIAERAYALEEAKNQADQAEDAYRQFVFNLEVALQEIEATAVTHASGALLLLQELEGDFAKTRITADHFRDYASKDRLRQLQHRFASVKSEVLKKTGDNGKGAEEIRPAVHEFSRLGKILQRAGTHEERREKVEEFRRVIVDQTLAIKEIKSERFRYYAIILSAIGLCFFGMAISPAIGVIGFFLPVCFLVSITRWSELMDVKSTEKRQREIAKAESLLTAAARPVESVVGADLDALGLSSLEQCRLRQQSLWQKIQDTIPLDEERLMDFTMILLKSRSVACSGSSELSDQVQT